MPDSVANQADPNQQPPTPSFGSAITKTYPAKVSSLTISDESPTTKILIRSDQQQFGLAFGSSRIEGDALLCATRPDEWLVLGSPDAVEAAEVGIDRGGFTNVIPFTHGRSLFRLSGSDAASTLEKVCGIDWSDKMTPNGAVVSASVALTTCDIIRHDRTSGTLSYLLMCDRSFGQYLFDALVDAGDEFDIAVSN